MYRVDSNHFMKLAAFLFLTQWHGIIQIHPFDGITKEGIMASDARERFVGDGICIVTD